MWNHEAWPRRRALYVARDIHWPKIHGGDSARPATDVRTKIQPQRAGGLQITDSAMILSNGRIVAEGSPRELVNNTDAKSAYFGDSFNF